MTGKLFYRWHTAWRAAAPTQDLAAVPQSEPLAGMVPNSAGGFAFPVDDWVRLDRFLILGSEGGSYYAGERRLTRENARAVERCIRADGPRTVARTVEVSEQGRAPSNDPALFVLALAAAVGDLPTRRAALDALPRVARTGTHLFHFVAFRGLPRLRPGAAPRRGGLVQRHAGGCLGAPGREVSAA